MSYEWQYNSEPKYTGDYIVAVKVASQHGGYREVIAMRYERYKGVGEWVYPVADDIMSDYPYDVLAWIDMPTLPDNLKQS